MEQSQMKQSVIELKHILSTHHQQIIEELYIDGAISCPECIIGNSETFCYTECNDGCQCDHSDCGYDRHMCYTCHDTCGHFHLVNGCTIVVAMLLNEAFSIDDNLFNKYNNLLNPDDKYVQKPYNVTLPKHVSDFFLSNH